MVIEAQNLSDEMLVVELGDSAGELHYTIKNRIMVISSGCGRVGQEMVRQSALEIR